MLPIFYKIINIKNKLLSNYILESSNSFYRKLTANMGGIEIGTHNGKFHCDEVLACYMLKLLPEYKDAKIVR